jgi:hypothetical protein
MGFDTKGRTHRERTGILQRRRRVAELFLQSYTQVQIAEQLGVKQPTVSADLRAVREEWRRSSIRDFDQAVEVELKKLELLEREAWLAWERSQEPQESTRVTNDGSGKGKKAEKTVRRTPGDPRFLDQIHKCIAARRALLGLDAPTRIAPVSPDGDQPYGVAVMAELMRLAEESKHGPVVIDANYIEREVERAIESQKAPAEEGKPEETISAEAASEAQTEPAPEAQPEPARESQPDAEPDRA